MSPDQGPAVAGPKSADTVAKMALTGSDTSHGSLTRPVWRLLTSEYMLVLALGLLVLAVHDVGYMLRQPYWNDESWVAITARLPLSRLAADTSTTPIGWSLLARTLTFGRSESARMLTLVFSGAAVMTGYWLARRLDWKNRASAVLAGLLAAAGVLLVPAMLMRSDLKQYTADAFLALLILAMTARLERAWSRGGLAALSVCSWGGMLVSHAALFAGVAALGALLVVAAARRAWGRLAETAVAAGCTAGLGLLVYEALDARAVVPGLTAFWQGYFLPSRGGALADGRFILFRLSAIHQAFGLGPAWLAAPLVVVGLVTVGVLGRPATAVAVAVLWPEMLALSALKKYPFLDPRTSTFIVVMTVVVAAIGVAGTCALLRAWIRGRAAATVTVTICVAAVAAFGISARPYLRSHRIPFEDVRGQAAYLAAHAGPHDPIVVNLGSAFTFGYYWPVGQPWPEPDTAVLQGYVPYFPSQPRIIVSRDRSYPAVAAAMTEAVRQVRPASCARIWLVRSNVDSAEQTAWTAVLKHLRLTTTNFSDGLGYVRFCSPR
jgi:hypothetical protein